MSEATPALSMTGTLSQLDGCALLLLQGIEEAVDIHVPSSAGSDLPITVSIVLRCDKCEEQQESGTEPLKRAARFELLRWPCEGKERVVQWSRELVVQGSGAALLREKAQLTPGFTYTLVLTRQPQPFPVTLCVRQEVGEGGGSPLALTLTPREDWSTEGKERLCKAYMAEVMRSGTEVDKGRYTLYEEASEEGEGAEAGRVEGKEEQQGLITRKELAFDWGVAVALVNGSECIEVVETHEVSSESSPLCLLAASPHVTPLHSSEAPLRVSAKVGPGERACFVLSSDHAVGGVDVSRIVETRLVDVMANSAAALETLQRLAMEEGHEHAYPEHPGVVRYAYDLPGGSALAYFNDAASRVRLVEDVHFDLKHMKVWQLLPDATVHALAEGEAEVPVSVSIEPGESHLIVLRPTEKGEEEGYSFGFTYTYSIEALV